MEDLVPSGSASASLDRIADSRAEADPLVLLVEPDPIIGLDLADALETAGLRTIGPLRTAAEAMAFLTYLTPDCAVLGQEHLVEASRALVGALRERGVPVVVHARQAASGEMAALSDLPALSRPAWPQDVIEAVAPLARRSARR